LSAIARAISFVLGNILSASVSYLEMAVTISVIFAIFTIATNFLSFVQYFLTLGLGSLANLPMSGASK